MNSQKNRDLIKQYPFVADILSTQMEPHGEPVQTSVDDLSIRVEKADGNLLFRQANNIGLDDSSWIFDQTGRHHDQIGRSGEYIFAVDETGKIINRVDWPKSIAQQKGSWEIYAWTVLYDTNLGNGEYTDPIEKKVKYLVWVSVEVWYSDTKNIDVVSARFGAFHNRTVNVTIYGEPDCGFKELHNKSSVYENLVLTTKNMMRGVLEKNHDIVSMGGMMYEMCLTFQDEVYLNGMRDIFKKKDARGGSGQFNGVRVLCAEMCGYERVMLEDSSAHLTLQLHVGSTNMYVLGQGGTLPNIRSLVKRVVKAWNEEPEARWYRFGPDNNVCVM